MAEMLTRGMGMFVLGAGPPAAAGGLPLALSGTVQPGFSGGAPLYAAGGAGAAAGGIGLVAAAPDGGAGAAGLNLSVSGANPAAAAGLTLFLPDGPLPVCPDLWQEWDQGWADAAAVWECGVPRPLGGGVGFVLAGDGWPNAAEGRGMNLFVNRPETAAVTFVLFGPGGPAAAGAPMVVSGAFAGSGGSPLAVPAAHGAAAAGSRLYTHGW